MSAPLDSEVYKQYLLLAIWNPTVNEGTLAPFDMAQQLPKLCKIFCMHHRVKSNWGVDFKTWGFTVWNLRLKVQS